MTPLPDHERRGLGVDVRRSPMLLRCGVLAAVCYVATDLAGALLYPGYSLRAQAVSELFAIGAPTRWWVAALFTLSSVLLLAFALGVWRVAGAGRPVRTIAVMFAASAVVGLLIWNVFPMHRRGIEPTFSDTMHLVLASNPFVLLTLVFAIGAFHGWFRLFTIATVVFMLVPAVGAFSYAGALHLNQPTPWLGALERFAQYAYQVWQVVLAGELGREGMRAVTP